MNAISFAAVNAAASHRALAVGDHAGCAGRSFGAARLLVFAFAGFAPAGRLVAITRSDLPADNSKWRAAIVRLLAHRRLASSAAIGGRVCRLIGATCGS
jgi:hypothetical protein